VTGATRLGSWLTVGGTALALAALLIASSGTLASGAELLRWAVVTAVGGLAIGVLLGTASADSRWRPLHAAGDVGAILTVAVGVVGGMLGVYDAVYPAASASPTLGMLQVFTAAAVLAAVAVAGTGAALARRSATPRPDDALRRVSRVLVLPVLFLVVFGGPASRSGRGPPETIVTEALAAAGRWVARSLVAPSPERPQVAVFVGMGAIATLAVVGAVRALPLTALLGRGDWLGGRHRFTGWHRRGWPAAIGVTLCLAIVEGSGLFRPTLVTQPLYDDLAALTTAPTLRWWLLAAIVGGGGVALAATAVRWWLRRADGGWDVGAVLVGGGVVVAAMLVHASLIQFVGRAIIVRLTEFDAGVFRTMLRWALTVYGGPVVVTATVVVVLLGALVCLAVLQAATASGRLRERTLGPTLAAAGTIAVATLGAALGVAPHIAFGGLVAGVLVWDAGEYGSTMAAEIGGGARRVELAHAGGTLGVGLVAAAFATFVVRYLPTTAARGAGLPLVVGVVGLLLLFVALRGR
jgi:hypothetical protein